MITQHITPDGYRRAPIAALRRFVTPIQELSRATLEHCELCSEVIPTDHPHLLDLSQHRILCSCRACAMLFNNRNSGSNSYRLVPGRFMTLIDFSLTDEQWDEFKIPVSMLYVFWSSAVGQPIAFYPGPAGATESLLTMESWKSLVENNPILSTLEPDTEALLINRVRDAREYYLVPIDTCYQLVGLIRLKWKGLSGGEEVWKAIEQFFAGLRGKSLKGVSNA